MSEPLHLVVMGVAGAGKTTLGRALADSLRCPFLEADDLHSDANRAKMARGEGLTDLDREPWLAAIESCLDARRGQSLVLACSALRDKYRARLAHERPVRFVYLDVPADVLSERLARRRGHYAGTALLASQLATLEPPRDAICVDGTRPVADLVTRIRHALGR